MSSERFLGVTVMPEYIQTESVAGVLDNLIRNAGVTAVATSPYVMAPAGEETGNREPPIDAGAGAVRLLDRPLWGKRELYVRTAPSFEPDESLYKGLRYQPPPPSDLTREHGGVIDDFVKAAKERGLKVYLQVQAAIPPGYRVQFGGPMDEDLPRLPDGRVPADRVAKNGSLASPHIRRYHEALLRDLTIRYRELDGLRVDWPEYPPYKLDSAFADFGPHAQRAAERLGIDFPRMRMAVAELYQKLHGGLRNEDLVPWTEAGSARHLLVRQLADKPGLTDFIRFKAMLVEELLGGFRRALTEAKGRHMELMPNAFPPPFTLTSGMDFRRAGRHSDALSVKLYTMHWPMILRFYGDQILKANPGLSDTLLTKVLVRWLDIADDEGLPHLMDYSYPAPDVPHPVGERAQARKIRDAQHDAGRTPVYTLVHGYGPLEDFRKRLRTGWEASPHGIWVNRYAYLTDEKVQAIGEICRQE